MLTRARSSTVAVLMTLLLALQPACSSPLPARLHPPAPSSPLPHSALAGGEDVPYMHGTGGAAQGSVKGVWEGGAGPQGLQGREEVGPGIESAAQPDAALREAAQVSGLREEKARNAPKTAGKALPRKSAESETKGEQQKDAKVRTQSEEERKHEPQQLDETAEYAMQQQEQQGQQGGDWVDEGWDESVGDLSLLQGVTAHKPISSEEQLANYIRLQRLLYDVMQEARTSGASEGLMMELARKRSSLRKCYFHAVNCW